MMAPSLQKIKSKLLVEKDISSLAISVAAFEGAVILTGAVENSVQKSKVEQIAKSVTVVKKVNKLLGLKKS